ncbi:MAG TPA: nucleotidyltransferase family protein [Candidatus Aquilonibacter sp.]|nr:nucleotidyltransferase family protein [Candidatus Aquilonibacter sp.]
MARVNAVVLAGGPADDVAHLEPGAPNKAFVRIGGVPLVARVIGTLRRSASIGRITVVAPKEAHADAALDGADERRDDGIKIRDSLRNGLAGCAPDEIVLVSTSDLPLLTAESIDDFVQRAIACNADLGYGCLERRVHEAAFPDVPHTWAHLRDGTYCGGGFIAIKPRVLAQLERFIEALGAARKNPLHLASIFGWDVLWRFAIRRLTITHAERRASQILGAPVRAIVSPFAETAVNVDRVSDVELAQRLVREQQRQSV